MHLIGFRFSIKIVLLTCIICLIFQGTAYGGYIVAWGNDMMGSVEDTPDEAGFVAISAGGRHSMALREDGSIVAWGWDNRDEVSSTPDDTGHRMISVGYTHSLAIRDDGTISAWGWERNRAGQISQKPEEDGFFYIDAGDFHNLAIQTATN